MNKYLSIGAGAALGALLRFLLSIGVITLQMPFYSGTLLVNMAGALLIGFFIAKELKPSMHCFFNYWIPRQLYDIFHAEL